MTVNQQKRKNTRSYNLRLKSSLKENGENEVLKKKQERVIKNKNSVSK